MLNIRHLIYVKKSGEVVSMLYSSEETLNKLAWLNTRKKIMSMPRLKIQKFLYFYEMFQKVAGEPYDIDHLKAYRNGPVFSQVYGDINYRDSEVYRELDKVSDFEINLKSAEEALFMVCSMTETELSELTHQFDMWQSKKDRINRGEQQIPITDEDISQKDIDLLEQIVPDYPVNNPNYHIISMQSKKFVISAEDYKNLTEKHYDILEQLSNEEDLFNPIYLSIEEDGGLLVD